MIDDKIKVMNQNKTTDQALVSIGGRGSRLRASGVKFPEFQTKSFLRFGGQPALHWTLLNLRRAGISNVVLAGEHHDLLSWGRSIALGAGFNPDLIVLFKDDGNGVHGLPFHASHLLAGQFLFEAGHGMAPASHYRLLMQTPTGHIGYSTFDPRRDNPSRTIVQTREGGSPHARAIALPYCLDTSWNHRIRANHYSIRNAVADDMRNNRALLIHGDFQPEFDQKSEYNRVRRRIVSHSLAAVAIELLRASAPARLYGY